MNQSANLMVSMLSKSGKSFLNGKLYPADIASSVSSVREVCQAIGADHLDGIKNDRGSPLAGIPWAGRFVPMG